jgi:hypothetical protein
LILLQTSSVIAYIVFDFWFVNYTRILVMTTICGVMDLLVQLMICYICWTQGSSSQLRKFECTITEDKDGMIVLDFKRKTEELDKTYDLNIGRMSVRSDECELPEHLFERETCYYARKCNEIVLQFIDGIDDDILSTEATDRTSGVDIIG